MRARCHRSLEGRLTASEYQTNQIDDYALIQKLSDAIIKSKEKSELQRQKALLNELKKRIFDQVWNRDKGIFQQCGKQLFEIVDPRNELLEELQSIPLNVYKWKSTCWVCKENTPLVSYDFTFQYDHMIGDLPKLDELLMREYSFVKRVYSKTQGKTVTANTCVHCGAYQGNWFTHMALLELKATGHHPEIDKTLPNQLQLEDFPHYDEMLPYQRKLPLGQIHCQDGNEENYDLDNLLLLCNDCIN